MESPMGAGLHTEPWKLGRPVTAAFGLGYVTSRRSQPWNLCD